MKESNDNEEQVEDESKPGIMGRAGAVARSAKRHVSRSAEVLSGADIRRFEDFTEAATTAIVGVHRDQAELREQLTHIEQSVNDVGQAQDELREQIAQVERSVNDLRQTQDGLKGSLTRMDKSIRSEVESRRSGLSRWAIALGAVAVAALLLSIVSIVAGTL